MIKNLSLLKIVKTLSFWLISITATTSLFYFFVNRAFNSNPQTLSSPPTKNLTTPLATPVVTNQETKSQSLLTPPRLIKEDEEKSASNQQNPSQTQTKQSQPSANQTTEIKTKTNTSAKSSPSTQKPQLVKSKPSPIPVATNYIPPEIEIRVGIKIDVDSLYIGTSNQGYLTDRNGKVLHSIPSSEGLRVSSNGNSLNIGNWQLPPVVWLQVDGDGLIYVDDAWYRGRLLLVARDSKVVAVNYVDLEHYLYSVVGSEMHPTANIEALKAQAIAARSYALVHIIRPASKLYSLGATQRWQAYKGIGKEYNTTIQAVNETGGQILSYQGGVVESLYAANYEIVNRVHKGRGMSQTGAYELANNGYNYIEILDNYYPGVQVAQLTLE